MERSAMSALALFRARSISSSSRRCRHGPRHGYGVSASSASIPMRPSGFSTAPYTSLHRMEERGWVASEWGISAKGEACEVLSVADARRPARVEVRSAELVALRGRRGWRDEGDQLEEPVRPYCRPGADTSGVMPSAAPIQFSAVGRSVTMLTVALVATLVPARRATRARPDCDAD